jgi:putative ribosome biogenesis GTPase RsgA
MVPKFNGDSDDWLDNEDMPKSRGGGMRPKKSNVARSTALPADEANAVVSEVFPNLCKVRMDENQNELLCNYRRAEVVSKSKTELRERTPVAVGDRVLVAATDSAHGVVEGICTRSNRLSRPAPGRDGEKIHHVLAANIDLLVIVVSAREPDFSLGLVDRFLVAAEAEGVPTVLCVSKIDLHNEGEKAWDI